MADDTTEPTSSTEPAEAPAAEPGTAEHKHGLKQELRDGVAKAVGYTVEVASILGQQGGPAVGAERDVAEANTEEFIDRLDGDD
jgi:hypothetical protein